MATSKHVRKTGATTVTKNGKIVGNIGKGKTHVPTPQESLVQTLEAKTNEGTEVSPIGASRKKFAVLSEENITFEQAQTLWNLTEGKEIVERLNILANYIDNVSVTDQEKLLNHIDADTSDQPVSSALCGRIGYVESKILDVFARYDRQDWKTVIAENKDTAPETLDFLSDSTNPILLFNIANHPHASHAVLEKLANYYSNDPAITEGAQSIIRQTAKENKTIQNLPEITVVNNNGNV